MNTGIPRLLGPDGSAPLSSPSSPRPRTSLSLCLRGVDEGQGQAGRVTSVTRVGFRRTCRPRGDPKPPGSPSSGLAAFAARGFSLLQLSFWSREGGGRW